MSIHCVSTAEIDAPRAFCSVLLSREERSRLVERTLHRLYRWYCDRSSRRAWNPDRSFDWRNFGQSHSERLIQIVEGFYAVEQYSFDYTIALTGLSRHSYGHSQFQLRWGAEEARHADVWRNILVFSRRRTSAQVEGYTDQLRAGNWTPPFQDRVRMLLYAVFQERATQIIYNNLHKISRGESQDFVRDADPVLAEASRLIAIDEAAHYDFFLKASQLYLYYFPEETTVALADVLRNFTMPAVDLIPNYDTFVKALYEGALFGRHIYAREVVPTALAHLGINGGATRRNTRWGVLGVQASAVEAAVTRLFDRLGSYEDDIGISAVSDSLC